MKKEEEKTLSLEYLELTCSYSFFEFKIIYVKHQIKSFQKVDV
jgi:hypothetical protein